jgi:hypothetical protein
MGYGWLSFDFGLAGTVEHPPSYPFRNSTQIFAHEKPGFFARINGFTH